MTMTLKNIITLLLITIITQSTSFLFVEAKSLSQKIQERIITDSKTLLSGAPIDYSYNESYVKSDSFDGLPSVPGCPKSDEGYPWVYFGSPPKCYLAGQQGPCDKEQKLFVKSGSKFGFCSCKCIDGIQLSSQLKDQFCKPHSSGTLEFVYVADLEKCFAIYEKGPCKENEWIVKAAENITSTTKQTYCEKRTCPIGKIPFQNEDGKQACRDHFAPFSVGFQIIANKEDCESIGMQYSELLKQCVPQVKKVTSI